MNQNHDDYPECRKIRRQIVCDDPGLTKLTVVSRSRMDSAQPRGPGYFFSVGGEWGEDGKRIGNNTHVEEMIIEEDFHGIADGDMEAFLSGLAKNRSIRKLTFHRRNVSRKILSNLFPLFKDNVNLESLGIFFSGRLDRGTIERINFVLAGFQSLKEFVFWGEELNDYDAKWLAVGIIDSLAGHPRLKKIRLMNVYIDIPETSLRYATLAVKLKKQLPELAELDLSHSTMDDIVAKILATGLFQKGTLKKINLRAAYISDTGWIYIFDALKSRNCRVEELNLNQNSFENDVRISLAKFLANNNTLKSLDLSFNRPVANAGWENLFAAFQSPTSALEKLNLASNSIDDDAAAILTNALVANNKLRELNLRSNPQITTMAWDNFLSILQNPNSSLEKLNLSSNAVGDDAIISLTNALVNNSSKLTELDLSRNHMITFMGWETFLAVLRSPNSALEKLNLDANLFNDAAVISFASALANNRKLKELVLVSQWHQPNINAGWRAFSWLLCNTSSILNTHISNHTLQKLSNDDNRSVPEDVRRLLQVNQENSKRRAARVKVIQSHFSNGFTKQPFVQMDLKVLPHAISWMGRDVESNYIDEKHYGFLRSEPSLFDRK